MRTEGQALVHLLMLATLRGLTVRGPMIGRDHAFALVRDWLGTPAPVERDRALAELARRYLVGHGPADDRDLARWAGLPLRDARAGLAAIASELHPRDDGLVDKRGKRRTPRTAGAAAARRVRAAAARLALTRAARQPRTRAWSPSTGSSVRSRWSGGERWPPEN